jgi:hypothetical protein
MEQNLSNVLTAITDQLKALHHDRAEHVRRIQEIDAKVAVIAKQLGVEPPAPSPPMERLAPPPDKRVAGSMPERMMDILYGASAPFTRLTLKAALRDDPQVGDTVRRNENTFYNAVKRYLDRGKIVELDGYLYHPDRAPLPDGTEDPTGQHFPSNVSSLFGRGGN